MPAPQNFLVVLTDQQRADGVGLAPTRWTPRLAAWAGGAVRLENTHGPSPHCCPSRATFFTRLYPSRPGGWNNILSDYFTIGFCPVGPGEAFAVD